MKSESPCIGCKKWKICSLAGISRMVKCERYQAWEKRLAAYNKNVGLS